MKLSELSTDRAADVLCELCPLIDSVVGDERIVSEIGKVENFKNGITKHGLSVIWAGRISRIIPILLKEHRQHMYGILSILNEKSVGEIAKQPVKDTIRQAKEVFEDEEFCSFFNLYAPQERKEQSAPSAGSPGSE